MTHIFRVIMAVIDGEEKKYVISDKAAPNGQILKVHHLLETSVHTLSLSKILYIIIYLTCYEGRVITIKWFEG